MKVTSPGMRWCAVAASLFSIVTAASVAQAQAMEECGSLESSYGPFDYASASDRESKLPIVEKYHFTPRVENLIGGESSSIPMELNYVLHAFPNHTRALWAMARYQQTNPRRPGVEYLSTECYFDRAIRWRPSDPNVWMVYGMYLARKGNHEEAIVKYEVALSLDPSLPEIDYNAGLAYFAMKKYKRALELAQRAYSAGYPLPGLKNMLKRVGQWQEPRPPQQPQAPQEPNTASSSAPKK